MKIHFYKTTLICIFIGFFVFANNNEVEGQQKTHYVTADIVLDNLIFGHRFNKSIDESNKLLIEQVQKCKVSFTLSLEEEESFKKIGASDLLIEAIRENYSKILQEQSRLYKKFADNYNGTLEQKKIALESAKEFVEKFSDDADSKEIIGYFKSNIPAMEKYLNDKNSGEIK